MYSVSDTNILGVKELIQNALSLSLHMGSSILAYALLTSPIGDTCTCKTVKLVESASYCVLKLLTTVPVVIQIENCDLLFFQKTRSSFSIIIKINKGENYEFLAITFQDI